MNEVDKFSNYVFKNLKIQEGVSKMAESQFKILDTENISNNIRKIIKRVYKWLISGF